MIGNLLFYVLYPISRYLAFRLSEASKKDLPPAVVNGTAVWDGGAVTTRRLFQSQTSLLDQWLSPRSGTTGETEERMKEPSPEKEEDTGPGADEEQLLAVLHGDTENEAASEMSEVQPAAKEKEAETINGPQEEGPKEEDTDMTNHHEMLHTMQSTDDGLICQTEVINPERELGAQLECLQMEDSAKVTTYPVLKNEGLPNSEDLVTPAETSIQETSGQVQEQIQIPSVKESRTPAKAPIEQTECWDEYISISADGMHGGESSELPLASLLSNSQIHLDLSRDTQTGWHFPAGPGLTEEVLCPLWQFPAMSYYPPIEPAVPFEVTWRVWEDVDESASAAEPALIPIPFTKASMDFTVMSYNILADDLLEANQDLYTHCPLEVLDWSYRCSLLLEEILKWSPDILCLQEVQENHYHEQLCPVLSQMGYTCVYKRRTGTKTDGCATCYRSSRFSEVSVTPLEFFRPDTELLDRHNVGIVVLLRPAVTRGSEIKTMGPPLCVANTHLLFNPRRGDVKLTQLAVLLAEIDKVVKSCKARGEHCNLIMCGDFNSLPYTPLYQLITTGELYYQGLSAWMVSGQEDLSDKAYCHRLFAPLWPSCLEITDNCQYATVEDEMKSPSQERGKSQYRHDFMQQLRFCPAACVRPKDLELIPGVTDSTPDASKENHTYDKRFRLTVTHRLDLESVYKHILPGSGNPEVTTLHAEAGATVDYIFYTPRRISPTVDKGDGDFEREGLKLIGSLSLLSEDVLWSMRGLPNHIFPSDHLSLLAKFQLELNVP
ncbi:protein angel homolog 1 [Sparus aurata]|uniref:Angel homolog 1 (Drosophila) n=1 Tax=Sparus aurata TaxID=8175 RepID=A0A671TYP9_SPAAU|nr:protein angel homolog 1 [Sparus aurata]